MSNSPTQQAIQRRQATATTLKEGAPFPFSLSPFPSKRGHGCQLDRKQEQAIAALLTQPSIAQAAQSCGLSESTLYRWLNYPPFQLAYTQARQQTLDTALGHLQLASDQFVTALLQLLADPNASPSVRLSAIRTGLQWSFHQEERRLLQQQILQLQDQIAILPPLPPAEAEPAEPLPLPPSLAPQPFQLAPQPEQSSESQSKIKSEPQESSPIVNRQSSIDNRSDLSSAVIWTSDQHGGISQPMAPLSPATPIAEAGSSQPPSSRAKKSRKQSKIQNPKSKIVSPYTYERDERGCWIKVPCVPPPPSSTNESDQAVQSTIDTNPLASSHRAAKVPPLPPSAARECRERGSGGEGWTKEVPSVKLDVGANQPIHSNVVLPNLDDD